MNVVILSYVWSIQGQGKDPAAVSQPSHHEILDLAIRLGRYEGLQPEWILYPSWASWPPEYDAAITVAAKVREWAKAILQGAAAPSKNHLPERRRSLREPWPFSDSLYRYTLPG